MGERDQRDLGSHDLQNISRAKGEREMGREGERERGREGRREGGKGERGRERAYISGLYSVAYTYVYLQC